MTIKSKITLALRNFFKKFGKIIFIALLVWIIIFIFNMYLRNLPEQLVATNTYDPDDPVIEYGGRVPENELSSVNETLENYLTYCKNKEYENAFNMLTDDCKNFLYNNNIENFKTYVDSVFTTYNNYSYNQNYSNVISQIAKGDPSESFLYSYRSKAYALKDVLFDKEERSFGFIEADIQRYVNSDEFQELKNRYQTQEEDKNTAEIDISEEEAR